jgi:hypothetical protein
MATSHRYFQDLRALLKGMPPGTIDMDQIEAHELRYGHRFADPPEIVERWLLDQQRRLQGI